MWGRRCGENSEKTYGIMSHSTIYVQGYVSMWEMNQIMNKVAGTNISAWGCAQDGQQATGKGY